MRVLDRVADLNEEVQPGADVEPVLIAVVGDAGAMHQLHDEVEPAGARGPGVEDAGDVGMLHQREGLALGGEAGDAAPGVRAELDDFKRDVAAHRLLLRGLEHHAAAALAEALQQPVAVDARADPLVREDVRVGASGRDRRETGFAREVEDQALAPREEALGGGLIGEHGVHGGTQGIVVQAGLIQETGPLRRVGHVHRGVVDRFFQLSRGIRHQGHRGYRSDTRFSRAKSARKTTPSRRFSAPSERVWPWRRPTRDPPSAR